MENYGLTFLPQAELDFLSLGALVHRLDPGIIPFRKASECRIHVSGGEFNCAANLSDCFRLNTGIAIGDGGLSHRRPDSRESQGDGRKAFLQAVQAQRGQRSKHGDGL